MVANQPAPAKGADVTQLVTLDEVQFSYPNGRPALDRLSLQVGVGEVVAVIGPSGCGKSTVLALINGSLSPTRGQVLWSVDTKTPGGGRRLVTQVFQADTVLPWLTVEQNVGFGLQFDRTTSKAERRRRVADLLKMGGLHGAAHLYPYQLSGGMRRRVAFLTAVAPYPKVLLLDEPFSSLDEPSRVNIHANVLSVVHNLGMSVILVTHDLAEAITLADTVYVLSRGPGRVVAKRPIPFGSDRDVFAVRSDDAYQAIYAQLWKELSAESKGDSGSGQSAEQALEVAATTVAEAK